MASPDQLRRDAQSYLGDCSVEFSGGGDLTLLVVRRIGRVAMQLELPSEAALARLGDVVFIANYSRWSDGCEVIAWDLQQHAQLWSVPLLGLGEVYHSIYCNCTAIAVEAGRVVLRAWEAGGRYIEVLDARNGHQVYHEAKRR